MKIIDLYAFLVNLSHFSNESSSFETFQLFKVDISDKEEHPENI